ncbi:hypothetical protein FIBSPDRAFT_959703 [Athelia psychrophila]|uniref:Exportin-2 central domain-containing protein n=1 Tax=Athelia psychrophila TaxID=1759441 RepID=A0A166D6H7_9AGAM|nr:hypothetical protein FIBSPDRAFT_959703 [Fibularhizoctonia sp. CBS 109695]
MTQHGVTGTNSLADVAEFFLEHDFGDLQAEAGTIEPILQVDAIQYLFTFRGRVRFFPIFTCFCPPVPVPFSSL